MAIDCTCNNTLQNLGAPDCPPVMQIARKFIFVPKYDSNGDLNKILLNDVNLSNLTTLINATDPANRYFPTAEMENVEDLREDPVTQEFNSGKIITVRDGFRTNTGYIPLGSTQELGAYKSYGCAEFGVYVLDNGGNFIYYKDASDPTYAYPILVDNETFHSMLIKATDAEVQMVMVRWQWKQSMKDQNLRFISSDSLDFGSEDLRGLYDTTAEYSAISTAGFTVSIETNYDIPVQGITLPDLTLFETTSGSPVDVTGNIQSWTETSAGVYELVFAVAEASSDTSRS